MRYLTLFGATLLLASPLTAAPMHKRLPLPMGPGPVRIPAAAAALPDTPEVAALRSAFQYAFPVYEMMRTRAQTTTRAQAAGISGINMLFPRKKLADATSRDVTTPNNDTLYASAWLDLTNGPVTLTVPDLAGRYNSAALMNVFTDNVAILGTRTGGGGQFTIVGPNWAGKKPEAGTLVRLEYQRRVAAGPRLCQRRGRSRGGGRGDRRLQARGRRGPGADGRGADYDPRREDVPSRSQ